MTPSTYLFFDGNCEEAFAFYAATLGGTIDTLSRYAGSPGAGMVPPEWGDKILYASMKLGEGILHGSDAPPGRYFRPQGFAISLQVADAAAGKAAFEALAEGGQVLMPYAATFFAAGFGMLTDRFGVPWMVTV